MGHETVEPGTVPGWLSPLRCASIGQRSSVLGLLATDLSQTSSFRVTYCGVVGAPQPLSSRIST